MKNSLRQWWAESEQSILQQAYILGLETGAALSVAYSSCLLYLIPYVGMVLAVIAPVAIALVALVSGVMFVVLTDRNVGEYELTGKPFFKQFLWLFWSGFSYFAALPFIAIYNLIIWSVQ